MRYLLLLPACLFAAVAHAASDTPEAAAQAFYGWVLAHPNVSLPSTSERRQLARLISPTFRDLLAAAYDAEGRCAAVTPRDFKPPLYEGSLFVHNYEGATEAAYRDARRRGKSVLIDVDLMYVEPHWPKGHRYRAVAWRDTVQLGRIGTGWLVTDIIHDGRSLAADLRRFVDEVVPDCIQKWRADAKPR